MRGLVPRESLSERLSAVGGAVTLVCAPAGGGKTVLLRSWVQAAGLEDRLAWVSIRRGERDGQRFWLSAIDALTGATGVVQHVGGGDGGAAWRFGDHALGWCIALLWPPPSVLEAARAGQPVRDRDPSRQAPRAVRQAARALPAHPGPRREDARRNHWHAAVLPADRPADRTRPAKRHDRRAGQAQQHLQGAHDMRRRPRHARRHRILLDHHVIRHMADIEAIHTYEGTAAMQTMIVGRDITGASAFA
jgi:hypothetical protein